MMEIKAKFIYSDGSTRELTFDTLRDMIVYAHAEGDHLVDYTWKQVPKAVPKNSS